MKLSKRLLIISLSLGAAIHAGAQVTWNGGGTDNLWSDAANWGGTAPTTNSNLIFDGSTRLTSTNDITGNLALGTITFNSGAGAFTIGFLNSASAGIRSGNITDNSLATETFNLKFSSTASRTVNVTSGGNLIFGGIISGTFGATTGLSKQGGGTLTLSAANTYTGATTVSAGTLKVTGSTVSATTVNSSATLSGTGTVAAVTLNNGGTIAAGLGGSDTTGNLKASSLTWNSASALTFNLDSNSLNSTSLTLSGAFTQGTGSAFNINLTGNGTFASAGVYDLVNFGSTTFTDASQFNLISSLNLDPGFTGALVLNGNQLDFDVTALSVPEPGTWALMLGGLGVLVFWQRRRSNA